MLSLTILALTLLLLQWGPASGQQFALRYRYVPGDAGVPSATACATPNAAISSQLLATMPLARLCHKPGYDEQKFISIWQHWDVLPIQCVT
jgi:hypothetical protein